MFQDKCKVEESVADPGFLEGLAWFRYTVAREFLEATPTFGKTTPISIVFETNYQPYQSNRSVFERISSKAF